jgi:hypothetical protein
MAFKKEQLIRKVRINLKEFDKIRYIEGTTTSSSGNDTQIISTNFSTYTAGSLVGAYVSMGHYPSNASGSSGHNNIALITAHSGTTITFTPGLADTQDSGQTFTVFDKGIWSDLEIIDYIANEIYSLPDDFDPDALFSIVKDGVTTSGVTGVAPLPADLAVPVVVQIDDVVTPVLKATRRFRFDNDAFLPGTTNKPVAIFSGASTLDNGQYGRLRYRPANNATITWQYIPVLPVLTDSQNLELPDRLADVIVLGATARAYANAEMMEQALYYEKKKEQRVAKVNNTLVGVAKQ